MQHTSTPPLDIHNHIGRSEAPEVLSYQKLSTIHSQTLFVYDNLFFT